ncbi:efflux RND transporter periplasmic adaptor subunit [Bacillus solimangrovi]|uniref:Uncharacterized protein n=1 Tax=Bacillus solimangrovi TaxID=1305675 RepID=A0A1E5LET5_9BACI|nr:HlyD family efflux transporter periplasmic adaptor subunit [Bacillus solimangrovi]OEH92587.1 hypothetical protein BFG57_14990 [Bacillus solimangrovi]
MKVLEKQLSIIVIGLSLLLVGCSNDETSAQSEKAVVVELQQIKEENAPIYLNYLGNVTVKDTKKYSFKTSGKVQSLSVEKGNHVQKGQEIARLETTELQYAVNAAIGQYQSAKAQYDKAVNGASLEDKEQAKLAVSQAEVSVEQAKIVMKQAEEAYQFVEDQLTKYKILYDEGVVAQNELDKLVLERELKQKDFENTKQQLSQAEIGLANAQQVSKDVENGIRVEDIEALKGQLEQSKANVDAQKKMLQDAVIYAEQSGVVSELPVKSGEVISAGYPVAVLRTPEKIVQTGITQQDINEVEHGTKVVLTINNQAYNGIVTYISDTPDMQTRTFETEIAFENELDLPLGLVAEVDFETGEQSAISIPVTSILNDGEKDYVYVIEEERAIRKIIEIKDLQGTNATVKGLKDSDKLVIKGMKNLRSGSLITTVKKSSKSELENKGLEEGVKEYE